jgi:hypothetical protein
MNTESKVRASLLWRHVEMVSHAYVQMRAKGWERPVVFIADLEDPLGRQFAAQVLVNGGDTEVQAQEKVAQMRRDISAREDHPGELIAAHVVALQFDKACAVAQAMTENGASILRQLPQQLMPVVVIGDGGNSYAGIPIPMTRGGARNS